MWIRGRSEPGARRRADIPPGKTAQVKVLRRNQEVTLSVTVGRRKPRAADAE